jgi:CRP-like cAMP-binding protein
MGQHLKPHELYLRKLQRCGVLDRNDQAAFRALAVETTSCKLRQIVKSDNLLVVCSGCIVRYGSSGPSFPDIRQPIGFAFEGQAINLRWALFGNPHMHYGEASCSSLIAEFSIRELSDLMRERPNVALALWADMTAESLITQQWMLNNGQRRARARIAFFLLEMDYCLRQLGHCSRETFMLPAVQAVLAAALGLSLVHYNKSMASLRDEGLITFKGRRITIVDIDRLRRLAHFDEHYLEPRAVAPCFRLPAAQDEHDPPGSRRRWERLRASSETIALPGEA